MSSFWTRRVTDGSTKTRSDGSDQGKPQPEIVMDPRNTHSLKMDVDTQPMLSIGNLVPDFAADSTQSKIEWYRWIGENWAILFSHPEDFAPVCTTEIASLAKLTPEFQKRGIKVAVFSANTVEEHLDWVRDIESSDLSEGSAISFPLISDTNRTIAETYGMLDPNAKAADGVAVTCRAVVLISPDKRMKMFTLYPITTGRNINEILRVIDSIQLNIDHNLLTPADWSPGDKCCIPAEMQEDQIKEQYGKVTIISMPSEKQYLRLVADPTELPTKGRFSWRGFAKSLFGVGSGAVIGLLAGKYVKPLRERLHQN